MSWLFIAYICIVDIFSDSFHVAYLSQNMQLG